MQVLFKIASAICGLIGYSSAALPTVWQAFYDRDRWTPDCRYFPLDDEHFPEIDRGQFILRGERLKISPAQNFESCSLMDPRITIWLPPTPLLGRPRPPQVASPPPPAVPTVQWTPVFPLPPEHQVRPMQVSPVAEPQRFRQPATYGQNEGYTFSAPIMPTVRQSSDAEVHASIVSKQSQTKRVTSPVGQQRKPANGRSRRPGRSHG